MGKHDLYDLLITQVSEILNRDQSRNVNLKAICTLLKDNFSYFDWVGFYLVDEQKPRELALGPFEGEPTEHVRIPFGKGICGQAALLEKTIVVQDVSKETNYIACSSRVKAEIVIPIFKNRKIIGELDIDSWTASCFKADDEKLLKKIVKIVSCLF